MRRTLYEPDHESFRDTMRAFVDADLRPAAERFAAEHRIDRDAWRAAGRADLLGLEVPEEYGGAGARDYRFNAVFNEELARFGAAYASCFGIHADVVAPYLVDLGTEEQKKTWLPRMCTGEVVTAIAMTEPSGGSDLARLRTSAVPDGDDWIVNGAKTFITNGGNADLVVVAARTGPGEGARGVSLFLVDTTRPGFERGRVLDKVGQPESDTAELFFTDLRLPADALLGEVGRGFVALMQRLPQERIGVAIGNVANAAEILDETLAYVKQREAFGQPIGRFQHNKFLVAELYTKVQVTQAFVDTCVLAHTRGELSAEEAAMAKWWAAEIQNDVLDHCLQLHGGYGYMNEYRVARAWKDARVNKIWAGSNEIMKELIGRHLGL
ncbi:MAG: acyl-CoA dehydrogenase family protein [Actinobacteria bacterium]|nr:acyl-CoA dehydrogenase family protein [Actinomycetota bacterium]